MAGVFGDGRDVSYPSFLSWATPGPDGLAASDGSMYRRQHRQPGAAASAAHEAGGAGAWNRKQHQGGGATAGNSEQEEDEEKAEEEAELKVRTALQRMGEGDGISRAWEEFEKMDPGGRRGGVQEEELVEVGPVFNGKAREYTVHSTQ